MGSGEFNKHWGEKKQNGGEVKPLGRERQPPAQEDTSQSTDPAGRPPLLPHSPTQGTWSHQLLPGPWLRALGRRRQVKVAPPLSHSPPLPHCPLPFPSHPLLGWALCSELGPRRAGEGAQGWGAHLGQTVGETGTALVCGGPLPGPAHSLPPERAGSLLPRPLGRTETRLTLGLVRDTRHSLAVGRRGFRESLGGGEPGRI